MTHRATGQSFPFTLYAGLVVFLVSTWLLVAKQPLIKTWYYCFAWWSIILVLDGLNLKRYGTSPMVRSPRVFFRTAFLSIGIWLIFELFNLRLENWSYHDLPHTIPLRWLGYSLAFATVVPALQELALFFSGPKGRAEPSPQGRVPSLRLSRGMSVGGGVLLGLPLLFPGAFFPFVWLGFIPLLEPWNSRSGRESLLSDLMKNSWDRIRGWLLAGLAAGILWEGLNYWAGSHWEYHIPYLNFGRIFQMPVIGYGGFLPFALEVFALNSLLTRVWERAVRVSAGRWLVPLLCLVIYGLIFHLMDIFTLVS